MPIDIDMAEKVCNIVAMSHFHFPITKGIKDRW